MGPGFQAILAMDCRREAIAPAQAGEVVRNVLDGGRVDEICVGAGIICQDIVRSAMLCSPFTPQGRRQIVNETYQKLSPTEATDRQQ